MPITNPYLNQKPLHEDLSGSSWNYLGTAEAIFDDTPGGLDDLWVMSVMNPPLFMSSQQGTPTIHVELLRAWGPTTLNHYRHYSYQGLIDPNKLTDPFYEEIMRRAKEFGYEL